MSSPETNTETRHHEQTRSGQNATGEWDTAKFLQEQFERWLNRQCKVFGMRLQTYRPMFYRAFMVGADAGAIALANEVESERKKNGL